MFPFDQASLPQLTSRRALIAIDLQNDFTSPTGALPIPEPTGYIDRTLQLASAIRETGGDVIWVKSKFEETRSVTGEKIIVNNGGSEPEPEQMKAPGGRGVPTALRAITAARRRERASVEPVEPVGIDPEAFLSKDEPSCLKGPSSSASDLTLEVQGAMKKADRKLTKSHYSAFNGTSLLHALRASMVMEVFICGSLTNVGVYATAMDAAGHGLSITIVEDCCGYRDEKRQRQAIESLIDFTGCEVASLEEVIEMIMPGKGRDKAEVDDSNDEQETGDGRVSNSPDIVNPMTGLRLKSKSVSPLDEQRDANAPGETDSLPISKLREATGIDEIETADGIEGNKEGKPTDDLIPAEEPSKKENETSSPPKIVAMDSKDDGSASDEDLHPQNNLCEGDTEILENVLPPTLEGGIFDTLRDEVQWQRMSHQGGQVPRLVAVQGTIDADGSMPVYRHPSDESPPLLAFSPTVLKIKAATEKRLGHSLNHALIQYYRDGMDYISEHSDKTLDIVKSSYIANVSLGAERTMVLRTKRQHKDPSLPPSASTTDGRKRQTQRARLPHNSLCRMGLKTNMKWLHSIRQDKRAERDKTPAELAFEGGRISLTFRQIGTFLDKDETVIWGQGATRKTREEAQAIINGTGPEAIDMIKAFGAENNSSTFDWEEQYGGGFDVLHMSSSSRLFLSPDRVVSLRIALMLAELGVDWAKGSMGPATVLEADTEDVLVKFTDNDDQKSTVQGELAIMLYLDSTYGHKLKGPELARKLTNFQVALSWSRTVQRIQRTSKGQQSELKDIQGILGVLNFAAVGGFAGGEQRFLVGDSPSLVDFVIWPTLHSLVQRHGHELFEIPPDNETTLTEYYDIFGARESTKKALGRVPLADRE